MEKVGIFLGNYGNTLQEDFSLPDLEKRLKSDPGFSVVRILDGQDAENIEQISRISEDKDVTSIVMAGALKKSLHEKYIFKTNGSLEYLPVLEANIREYCDWFYSERNVAIDKAERLIRITAARAKKNVSVTLSEKKVLRKVMIVGGSVSAFEAAKSAASTGLNVILFKNEMHPDTLFPPDPELIKEIQTNSFIEIIENAEIRKLSGEVGNFYAHIIKDGITTIYNIGALVIAVDSDVIPLEFDEKQIGAKVHSLKEFMDDIKKDNLRNETVGLWLDRAVPERRDVIVAALIAAKSNVKNEGKSYVFLRNMPVFGHLGQKEYDEAREIGVQFLRYADEHPFFERSGDKIEVSVNDPILRNTCLKVQIDRLIMPNLIMPGTDFSNISNVLQSSLDNEGFLQTGNVRHRPVSSTRKGVFFAGNCHDDYDPMEARLEAEAVTTRILEMLPRNTVELPAGMVNIDKGKCAKCLTCVRSCPHGAIDPNNLQSPINIFDSACWECGICAALCPGQAIEHKRFSDSQFASAIKTASREILGEKPLVIFACKQSAVPSLNKAAEIGLSLPIGATIIEVPCAGRVEEKSMLEALANGAGRVMVTACHPDICRSLRGNILAGKRIERVQGMLSSMGLNPGLVQYQTIAANEPYRIVNLINDMGKQIEDVITPVAA